MSTLPRNWFVRLTLILGLLLFFLIPARSHAAEPGLLLYLPLAEDLADHSGNNLTITNMTSVRIVDGAAYFDGQTNWLEAPNLPLNSGPFAISLWLKPTGKHPMYGLLEQKSANSMNRWLHVMLRGGRQPYLGFYINDAISPEDIPVNEWTHLVFQYSGKRQEIWVNGQFLCARDCKSYGGKGGTFRIGYTPRWNNVPSKDFEGYMRELRIYNHALTPQEILAHYNPAETQRFTLAGIQPPPEPRITLATRSNETAAAENGAPFLSISGNNLTITGESRQIYDILVTDDLNQPWVYLMTVTNKLGVLNLIDEEAKQRGNTFYRIQVAGPKPRPTADK
jgi:hypothetical protein